MLTNLVEVELGYDDYDTSISKLRVAAIGPRNF